MFAEFNHVVEGISKVLQNLLSRLSNILHIFVQKSYFSIAIRKEKLQILQLSNIVYNFFFVEKSNFSIAFSDILKYNNNSD